MIAVFDLATAEIEARATASPRSGPAQVFMVSSRKQLEDVKRALNLD